jgi:arsenite methyltransferase
MRNHSPDQLKEIVRQQYTSIANQDKEQNLSSCCGSTCCSEEVYNIMADDYSQLQGYNPDADLGLGCGIPTGFAKIKTGDTVLDLGSGAGNDCFIALRETGPTGKVIGLDMTEAMIQRARRNAEKLGYNNVEFRNGDIEQMPVSSASIDVVISNCVLNLVPDKQKAYSEIFRVLKPGGHFSISDVVSTGSMPAKLKQAAEMYAGCVSGAIEKSAYIDIIKAAGFNNLSIQKEKRINIPEDILSAYLSADEISEYKNGGGILSITVYAEKKDSCCDKDTCCK